MMQPFAIFYDDGSIVEGGDADDELVDVTFKVSKKWLEAPNDGVQGVVFERGEAGKCHWEGNDYYMILPDEHEFYSTDDLGPFLRQHLKGIVKFGLCVSQKHYEEHADRMKQYSWDVYQQKIKPYKQRNNG